MERRRFLSSAAQAASAVALATAAKASPTVWLPASSPSPLLRRADFERWLNSSFELNRVGRLRSTRARLVAVNSGPATGKLEQFHALFDVEGRAASGLYELRHEGGRTLQLWLDPAGGGGATTPMCATFSLMVAA